MTPSLTLSQMTAAAVEALQSGGYSIVADVTSGAALVRVFEDPYGIVGVTGFETWRDLAGGWSDAQAEMTIFMARHLSRPDPKAWEGYLVLLTPQPTPLHHADEAASIRYDTSRLRKIVITGDQAAAISDVERRLAPVLPLQIGTRTEVGPTLLEQLPGLLEADGIDPQITRLVVDAFVSNQPIVERVHEGRRR
jgi:hypothetical protein